MLTYIDVINHYYPNLQLSSFGDGTVYENFLISQGSVLPTKSDFDTNLKLLKQDYMWKKIQIERDRRKAGGVYIASISKWFHSDVTSRIQHLGLVMMGASLPNNIMWKTMDGSFIKMSPAIAGAIFQQIAYGDVMMFGVAEQHRTQMVLLDNAELYDFTTSPHWPTIFGE